MKMILRSLIAPLLLLSILSEAQVTTDFNNKKSPGDKGYFSKAYNSKIDFEIPGKNIDELLKAEKRRNMSIQETQPFQIAVPVPVNLDIDKLISWHREGDSVYGKYTVRLDSALSSSINFDNFYLPEGTEMYIYNDKANMITGPITAKENNQNKIWGSWVYEGPLLTIEIKTPLSTLNQLILHASNIAYGYKKVYQVLGFGQSAACEINVLCPLGNGWQNERNSVSLILSDDGSRLCSGAMIMNTCSTNRPFYLTADHCFNPPGLPQQNVAAWRFTFQAWSPTCTPTQNSNGITYNGSTLRANWQGTDFCLVELNQTPAANSGISYAGWNRNNSGISQTTILHHPAGDVMKVTNDLNPPVAASFLGAQCWHLSVDNGITEGGSSGAPYFDQNHRIVGQHSGIDDGLLPICNQVSKYGGRFDISWSGGGTNTTRLSNWLDPGNTGAMTTNTTYISNLFNVSDLSITGADVFCSTQVYSINTTLPVTWSASPSGIASLSTSGNSVTATKMTSGAFTLTAQVATCNGSTITLEKEVSTEVRVEAITIEARGCYTMEYEDWYLQANPNFPVASNWQWKIDNPANPGNIIIWSPNTSGTWVSVKVAGGISVSYQDPCGGTSTLNGITVYNSNCRTSAFTISPNPAKEIVTIDVVSLSDTVTKSKGDLRSDGIKSVIISNSFGRKVKERKFNAKSNSVQIDVSSLPQGIYYVRVEYGQFSGVKQLMIE